MNNYQQRQYSIVQTEGWIMTIIWNMHDDSLYVSV
jgi:hypothetical protein